MVRHVAEIALAAHADSVHVVLGAEAKQVESALKDLRLVIVRNPGWKEGISSSIREGIHALPDSIDGALVLLCDQPMIKTELVDTIIESFAATKKSIVSCEYGGGVGVPALFERSLFPQLLALKGDRGAKQILESHIDDAVRIPFPGGTVDIDTEDSIDSVNPLLSG